MRVATGFFSSAALLLGASGVGAIGAWGAASGAVAITAGALAFAMSAEADMPRVDRAPASRRS